MLLLFFLQRLRFQADNLRIHCFILERFLIFKGLYGILKPQVIYFYIMIHEQEPNGESQHYFLSRVLIICSGESEEGKITLTTIRTYNLNKNI